MTDRFPAYGVANPKLRPYNFSDEVPQTVKVAMIARIFKPAKTAMQSGLARTKEWVLEFAPASPREIDPLMGWTSSRDMRAQVQLDFDTKDEAVAYAERERIPYKVFEPRPQRQIRKTYADNFKFGRIGRWTH